MVKKQSGTETKPMNSHRGLLHHININVSDFTRSRLFYGPVLSYLGYELKGFSHEGDYRYEDWGRWELEVPHEISIVQGDTAAAFQRDARRAVGRFNHMAFGTDERADVDRLYAQVLVPLEEAGLCVVEDPPCECPEHDEGYYATFFFDPDGIKYEFVVNPNYFRKKRARS